MGRMSRTDKWFPVRAPKGCHMAIVGWRNQHEERNLADIAIDVQPSLVKCVHCYGVLSMRVLAIAALTAMMAAPCHAIVGGTATTAFQAVGVGVQVTPDWVVTAWHIAPGVGSSYSNGYGSRTVLARYDAPGSGAFPANDLTLLRLTPTKAVVPSLAVAGNTFASGSVTPLDVTITSPSNSGPARGYGFTTVSQFAKQSGLVTVN